MHRKGSDKMKRQSTKWGEIFANGIPDKELISCIYKLILPFHTYRGNHLIEKWTEEWNRHLSEEEIQKVSRYKKRCPT